MMYPKTVFVVHLLFHWEHLVGEVDPHKLLQSLFVLFFL